MPSTNLALVNDSQAIILSVLAKHKGMGLTLAQIRQKVGEGVAVDSGTIGPVFSSVLDNYPDSLHTRGLVKVADLGDRERLFSITDEGREVLSSVKFRRKSPKGSGVPGEDLDKAVRQVRDKKTYGIELWTDTDIKEVRTMLPAEFSSLDPGDLRRQICNRRKRGAYADPLSKTKKAVESAIRYFGQDGELIRGMLTSNQLQRMRALLAGGEE